MEVQHIEQWSKDQVKEWIIKEGFSECSNLFYGKKGIQHQRI